MIIHPAYYNTHKLLYNILLNKLYTTTSLSHGCWGPKQKQYFFYLIIFLYNLYIFGIHLLNYVISKTVL